MKTDSIAHLSIVLEDVAPTVTRRLEVPVDIRLDELHLVMQAAMGWWNSHLWAFSAGEERWGVPDPGWPEGPQDTRKVTLRDVVGEGDERTLVYLYDFGDSWEHTITVERIGEPEKGASYPKLIAAENRCPPEDVGGAPGYEEFLEAMDDVGHESHDELVDWWGGDFDPHSVEFDELATAVSALGKGRKRAKREKAK